MLDPKNFMAFLESIRVPVGQPDAIDYYWWSDDELLNLAFDEDAYRKLNEQSAYDLVWQLAKRYQDLLDSPT